jgi:DNA repair exonuclease SbcCD nuclease subunit
MNIIHLTDIHIGADDCLGGPDTEERDAKIIFDNIVANIIADYGPNANENVIAITGDLVDDATKGDEINISVGGNQISAPKQYKDAKDQINRLSNAGFQVLVIPGNHDYGSGGMGYSKYVKKFKEVFFGNDSITYPKLDWDIHHEIAFIGLDSMAAILTEDKTDGVSFSDDNEDNDFDELGIPNYAGDYRTGYLGAYGKLGKEQLKDLDDMLYGARGRTYSSLFTSFSFPSKLL